MSDKELQRIEKALSLVSDPVFNAVMQNYLDSYGLDMEVTRDNCVDLLENIYNLQVEEEEIGFDYFYDVLCTLIQDTVAEMLYPEEDC